MTVTVPHSLFAVHGEHDVRQGNVTWPNMVYISRPLLLSTVHFISEIFWHAVLDQ